MFHQVKNKSGTCVMDDLPFESQIKCHQHQRMLKKLMCFQQHVQKHEFYVIVGKTDKSGLVVALR